MHVMCLRVEARMRCGGRRRGATSRGEGKARWRAIGAVESGVWLGRASQVPARGGPMETRKTTTRSGEAGGDGGKACLVAGLASRSISSS